MTYYKSAEEYYKEMTSTLKDVDTSEHSFIYNSNMPTAFELSYQSMLMDEIENKIHAKTALDNGYYDSLINFCKDLGIERNLATKASGVVKITGNAGSKLPSGSYVAKSSSVLYTTQDELTLGDNGEGTVSVIAVDVGSSYNCEIGEINSFPIKYEGILTVTNELEISNGYDDESYESLYNRYLSKVTSPSTGGNKADYENWALSVTGTGSATCVPGAGNVKVIISNSNKREANEELIQNVYDYIDSVRPLLAGTLTIESVKEVKIKITGNVEIDTSVTLEDVKQSYENLVNEYFDDKVFTGKKISIAKLQSLLIDMDGVIDCSNVTINESSTTMVLNDDEVAVLDSIELVV